MSASIPVNNLLADQPLLESRHTGLLMAALMGVAICQFLDMTIANVALPHMQTSLGAAPDTITWALTSFIIAGVLVLPLTGWLADRIGTRKLFLASTIVFLVASMACGASVNLTQIVIFRAIQGMASAFIGPLSQTILLDINRPSAQPRAMALWGMVVMIGPISGPFLGGVLTESLNWRWVFYINLPIGIPALVILWWLLPSRAVLRRRLDVFGAAILGLGLCALQLMLDRGQHKDWFESGEIVIEAIFAVSAFWIFFIHSRFVEHPLFNRGLISNKNFLLGMMSMLVIGFSSVALSAVLPAFFQSIYHYNVMQTGMLMVPRGVGMLFTMVLANRLMRHMDPRHMIVLGYLIAAYSLWMMTSWSLEMDRWPIITSTFIQGLGLGLVFVPVNLMAFATLPPVFRTEGATLLNLSRSLGGSFGISLIVTMLARNTQASHADIAANVTPYSLPSFDPSSTAAQFGSLGAAMLAMLNGEVNRQAAMIAYLDNFYTVFWIVLLIAPVVLLAKRPPQFGAR